MRYVICQLHVPSSRHSLTLATGHAVYNPLATKSSYWSVSLTAGYAVCHLLMSADLLKPCPYVISECSLKTNTHHKGTQIDMHYVGSFLSCQLFLHYVVEGRLLRNGRSGAEVVHMFALSHWGRDKMAAIFQTFSNAFSWMKMYEFR